jgi:hypothetical protein
MDEEDKIFIEAIEDRLSAAIKASEDRLTAATKASEDRLTAATKASEDRLMTRINANQEDMILRMRVLEVTNGSIVETQRLTNLLLNTLVTSFGDFGRRLTDLEGKGKA